MSMFNGSLWPLSALFVLLAAIIRFWYLSNRLRHIPGPLLARSSSLWLGYQARVGQRYRAVDQAYKKYGPVVRISPTHVSIADRTAISAIYGHGKHALDKTTFYKAFVSEHPSVFSTIDKQNHARKRRLVSHAFSKSALDDFSPFVKSNIKVFVAALDAMSISNTAFDLLTWINYLTFDVLSDLAFGKPIGMLEAASDVVPVMDIDGTVRWENAIELVDGREHLSTVLGLLNPRLRPLMQYLPDPFFRRSQRCSDGLTAFARQQIAGRLKSKIGRNDILGKLISAFGDDADLGPAEVAELVGESVTLLSAGSDTTATTVCAIIHFLGVNPVAGDRLLQELRENLDTDSIPDHRAVGTLSYLQATILEGLRLHATMASGLPRYTPAGGLDISGIHIPANTEISVPAYTIQHDVFWADPHDFNPDRWLGTDAPALKKYMLAFGTGPRSCLGKHLAYMEMRMIVGTLVLRYDISLLLDTLHTTVEGFVHKVVSLPVRIKRR